MSDADPQPDRARRQAPRWGEYATPEEVAELRGPDAEPPTPVVMAEGEAPPPPSGPPRLGPPPPGYAPTWDRFVTFALLALGLVQVVSSVAPLLQYRESLRQQFEAYDYDVDVSAAAGAGGIVLLVVNIVLYVAALLLSLRQLHAGRHAFWIPLAAGVAAALAQVVVILVVAWPAVAAAVQNQG